VARRRSVDRWLVPYLRQRASRGPPAKGKPVHLLLCIADHFEPRNGDVSADVAGKRVDAWVREYPRRLGGFRDSDGKPPRHTFFYPIEQYDAGEVDAIASLCAQGFGEVEIHLHHDNDTAENLRQTLAHYRDLFSSRHGLLARDAHTGRLAYGFVHGNWALDNSRPDGRWCGVDNELSILHETGCCADFTLPSAPNATQTRTINSIYYAAGRPGCRKCHDTGLRAGVGEPAPLGALMLIQGPLLLDWQRRKWGLVPRIENGCIQSNQPPTSDRLDLWLRARVQVPTRPDWFFVKLHTHGAPEENQRVLLGDPMVRFHEALAERAARDPMFHVHYVTAREMYNLARAAESGYSGAVEAARDFELAWNGAAASVAAA
jgi:hypothetical protein